MEKHLPAGIYFVAPALEPVEMTEDEVVMCAARQGCPVEAYLDHFEHEFGVRPKVIASPPKPSR